MYKIALSIILLIFTACSAQAEDEQYVEGVHYKTLSKPLQTSFRGEEIGEVMEFFSYSCIHCYNFEPAAERFLAAKPETIRFTQVPVMFNDRQAPEVRAYYVVELLKLGKDAHSAIFNEIHVNRRALRTDKKFSEFFTRFGVNEDTYMEEAYSFGINTKLNTSIYLTKNSEIAGTPSIIANGKYLINSGAVGGNEQALYVAQWLIERDAEQLQP